MNYDLMMEEMLPCNGFCVATQLTLTAVTLGAGVAGLAGGITAGAGGAGVTLGVGGTAVATGEFTLTLSAAAVELAAAGSATAFGASAAVGTSSGSGGTEKWDTPEGWANRDHAELRDRIAQEKSGYESGRHNEYPREMRKRLGELADEADARGDLEGYGKRLREIAETYKKREGAKHPGGRR